MEVDPRQTFTNRDPNPIRPSRRVPIRASRLPAVAPLASTINRQEVAGRSNRSSNDDERVPDGTDPSRRPTGQAQRRSPRLNVGQDCGGGAPAGERGEEGVHDVGAGHVGSGQAGQRHPRVVVEDVEDFDLGAVGELPVGDVGLPELGWVGRR